MTTVVTPCHEDEVIGIPADLGVVMGVRIDEARRHNQIRGVDYFLRALHDRADFGYLASGDRDVSAPGLAARAVHDRAILDQKIV
jgi:hypothetical protein